MPWYTGNPDEGYYTLGYARHAGRFGFSRGRGRSSRGFYQNSYSNTGSNRRWTYYYNDYDAPREDPIEPYYYQENRWRQRRFREGVQNRTYYTPTRAATVDEDGDEIMDKCADADVLLEMEQPSVDFDNHRGGYEHRERSNNELLKERYNRRNQTSMYNHHRRHDENRQSPRDRVDRVLQNPPFFKPRRGFRGGHFQGYDRGRFYYYGDLRRTRNQWKIHLESQKRADWRNLQENLNNRAEPGQLSLSSTRAVNLSLDDIISTVTNAKRPRLQ